MHTCTLSLSAHACVCLGICLLHGLLIKRAYHCSLTVSHQHALSSGMYCMWLYCRQLIVCLSCAHHHVDVKLVCQITVNLIHIYQQTYHECEVASSDADLEPASGSLTKVQLLQRRLDHTQRLRQLYTVRTPAHTCTHACCVVQICSQIRKLCYSGTVSQVSEHAPA